MTGTDDCPEKNPPPAQPRKVWYLDRSMYESGKGFRPVVQFEGEHGFTPQGGNGVEPYYLGHDYESAKAIVDEWNNELGIDPKEAREIVTRAMFPGSMLQVDTPHFEKVQKFTRLPDEEERNE